MIELPVHAAKGRVTTQGTPAPEPEYRNSIRPYLWTAGLKGDITAKGTTADVDVSFSDILDALDFALNVGYEHRFDGWSLLADLMYSKIEADAKVANTEVNATSELAYFELSGAFDIDREYDIEPIVGARCWYTSVDIDVAGFGGSDSNDWVDPLVGARWTVPLDERWSLRFRGDVGGFGIGTASDLSWQAQAVTGYALSQRTTLAFGYRYLKVDRGRGSGANETESDIALHGLLAGLDYRF